ncbi:glycosyltransferase family 8 [Haloferula helveola]|uniref:Glycosyltransferase family 8 n=1 Tax=Haloferula helveola TaxID=490095 RepID=A0ABN6H386_9BACT|nr:glycosyltransferase family 8 [Haloferula helveola]
MSEIAYLSFLATDDFLPGVRVLAYSLARTRPKAPLLVLVTDGVGEAARRELQDSGIAIREVDAVPMPEGMAVVEERWRHSFTKLRIFEQTEFAKAVYLDADMLVCANLDELFERPHMSAVNAGGMLPQHSHWVDLNAGLLVIEPDQELFGRMLSQLGQLEGRGQGDQSFLHSFYPDWPKREELHLDHAFNQCHLFLDEYRLRFGYRVMRGMDPTPRELAHPKLAKVIHYIGPDKPWLDLDATRRLVRRKRWTRPQMARALKLWLDFHEDSLGR